MEAEQLILPDNTVIDPTQPPPGFDFPKPDFTEIVQDHPNEPSPLLKPTFKNILQAKKRLQAFSSTRPGSLPSSPKKVKANEEKGEETTSPVKKTPRKGTQEKPKSVIEQIEELKREEQANLELRLSAKRSRSRSRSPDKGRFKKVDKKSRNYRRGSINSPEKLRKSPKKARKYPKNWREFYDVDADFEINRAFEISTPAGHNELLRQVLFESPSLPIVPFKMKTVNREEKHVPFQYVRYTRTKPVIPYSVNFGAIKESCLSRKAVLDSLPKDIVANIEKLYSNSFKFTNIEIDARARKSMMWYPKVWRDSENECKIFEKSVGLSFLQNYTGEEDENDFMEEETVSKQKSESVSDVKEEGKLQKNQEEIDLDKDDFDIEVKPDKQEEKKKKKKDKLEEEKLDEEPSPEKKGDKKKKRKVKKDEDGGDEDAEKKKNKQGSKEKKKHSDEGVENISKKRKRKKDKLKKKKDKREKEKKTKHKKVKEKKKKDQAQQEQTDKPAEKLSKQQVIEELREIEEKLAKKREEGKEKAEKKNEKEDSGRKRKHSERESDAKKTKHDKHRRTSEEHRKTSEEHRRTSEEHRRISDEHRRITNEEHRRTTNEEHRRTIEEHRRTNEEHGEVKVEHALKSKLEKAKKDMLHLKTEVNDLKRTDKDKSDKPEEFKKEDQAKRNDYKKQRCFEENTTVRKRKSRWSENIKEELPELRVVEEINAQESVKPEEFNLEDLKIIEEIKENTPDTDEYHSHWESDEDVSSSVPRNSLKLNRSWESDEELFERSHNRNKTPSEDYASLEIPLNLNIKAFPRRSSNWDEKNLSVIDELKLLEEERRSLSEERRKLELEKQKILKMQEEAKLERLEEKKIPLMEMAPDGMVVKVKKEKSDEFSLELTNSLSNVSSAESNFPIGALENEYEEFIKAVSSESSVSLSLKKKPERRSSSSSWSSDSDHKKKKRKAKLKKKKKKKKLPSDLPEMVPTPVPVPSPMLPLDTLLPITAPTLLLNSMVDLHPTVEEPKPEPGLDLKKPFVFSSIVLPSKKTPLVDNSNLKLDDDSDSADFTDKFVKKLEEDEEKKSDDKEIVEEAKPEDEAKVDEDKPVETKIEEKEAKEDEIIAEKLPEPVETVKPVEIAKPVEPLDVPLPPEKAPPKPTPPEPKPEVEPRPRRSPSVSPPRRPPERVKDKRRSRSRSPKRRSPIRRREPTPPSRRRYSSPRRRSPPRRRGSPRRRSPSPRRRSSPPPPRRRRRSPSPSPPRSRGGARKRTPSPRRRASPLNSPLDGFKRSVADSTISDDMLPQPNPDDYSESPPPYGGGAKYYDRKSKRSSLSPQMSPRRISLDDRINQVLGLEKNEPPPPPPKPQETYPNYGYGNAYMQQYPQYGQYPPQTPTYGTMMYTQPPPPIVKPPPTKVVQVGNILQVVPTEELPPAIVDNKTTERSQKIVQVGNMLQIVPAIIPVTKAPVPEPQPVIQPVQSPEKQSAESVMKQKIAERKAEREKRRLERERRRKEKERKRKEKEKRKQMKLKMKTENMIKRAIQLETEAMANDLDEEAEPAEQAVQWPPVPVVVAATPNCKGILSQGGAKQRKSVQFADGVRPGEGTSPSGGEELSSPPPHPRKLPKEKRYKKLKIPKKSNKKKVRVKVVKVTNVEEDDDDDDNLPPPSPPPGSPPPHVFPSRVKTHTINNVHQYVGNIMQSQPTGYPFRAAMPPVIINRHQPPPGYMAGAYPQDVNSLSHQAYQGVSSHH